MVDECAEQGVAALDVACGASGVVGQRGKFEGGQVGQCVSLQMSPEVLDRVEFGRIGRKVVGVEFIAGFDECLHGPRAVPRQAIPYELDGAGQCAEQVAQKTGEVPGKDVLVGIESKDKPDVIAFGRDAQRGDGRDFLMGSRALVEHRRLAPGTPRAANQRRHQESAFVYEGQPRAPLPGFFLMRGHSCRIHPAIASSSRSAARRCGFCGLHPKAWSTRQT